MNEEQKLLKTLFSKTGDKWQFKILFLEIFDLHSSIVLTFLIAAFPV